MARAAAEYCYQGVPIPIEYSGAVKVYCTQVAFEIANEAVQLHGAYGLTKDYLAAKFFKDARGALIGDGCNEMLAVKRCESLLENYLV